MLSGLSLPHHHLRLSAGTKADLRMWCECLEDFNGIPMAPLEDWVWGVSRSSDASGSGGVRPVLAGQLVRRRLASCVGKQRGEHSLFWSSFHRWSQ